MIGHGGVLGRQSSSCSNRVLEVFTVTEYLRKPTERKKDLLGFRDSVCDRLVLLFRSCGGTEQHGRRTQGNKAAHHMLARKQRGGAQDKK